MLAEHTFITTLDADEVMALAELFLRDIDYRRPTTTPPADHAKWRRRPTEYLPPFASPSAGAMELLVTGGARKARAWMHFADLPRAVSVRYDRGRVTVAASIHEHGKVTPLHQQLVLAVASGLEQVLAQGQPRKTAVQPFDDVIDAMDDEYEKRRRRRWTFGCGIVFFSVLFIILILLLSAIITGYP